MKLLLGRICAFLPLLVLATTAPAETSQLWGASGELWSPSGRLPDFSFAGYRRGEAEIPTPPVTHNLRDFGAKGDDTADDSDAFIRAIAAMESGVLLIPEGRYVLTKMLVIDKPNIVLRGEGPDKTTLYFPTPLNDIEPNWGATTSGRPTSNYSWSGGFIATRGSYGGERLAAVTAPALRGGNTVTVNDATAFVLGQEVEVRADDTEDNSLARHLYSDDPRTSLDKLNGRTQASLVARITAIEGNTLTVDRPLRFDLRPEWKPDLHRFAPTVTECGVEGIRFEFPNTPYGGHFTELGYNAIALSDASHCWVRNVHIHNADSGVFVSGCFNTIDGIGFSSERAPEPEQSAIAGRKAQGHHAVILGDDNLCTNFDFRSKLIHDLCVSGSAGNVYSKGRGLNLSFDHHRNVPYENLYTNIDVGAGTEIWRSGGGEDLGAHCAARGTFWNIRANQSVALPPDDWGPWSMNFVGLTTDAASSTKPDTRWVEAIPPADLQPPDLHEAQLRKRLRVP
jgi:hypothetical protein